MITISTEVIIGQKVLPYDIYDSNRDLLFGAGEILTPGKILIIRDHDVLYIRPEEPAGQSPPPEKAKREFKEDASTKPQIPNTTVNKISKISPNLQLGLKTDYTEAIEAFTRGEISIARKMFLSIRDQIFKETQSVRKNVHYCSELKLLGEQQECHALNTAIYSAFLAIKLGWSDIIVLEVILSALLHDIGKTKFPAGFSISDALSKEEEALYRKHPIYGYNIIKYKLKFPESIAKVALEHHETMDGTGWPYGISNTMISEHTQIVAVCSHFDVLTSRREVSEIKNFRDALRSLLTMGSKTFSPKPLYAFVHMLNYGDIISFEELLN